MQPSTIAGDALARWRWIHSWSSLVCTLFLLLLCITGLPLIFKAEIEDFLEGPSAWSAVDSVADLDAMVAQGRARYPAQRVLSVLIDDDDPVVLVRMAPSWDSVSTHPETAHTLRFDARTGNEIAADHGGRSASLILPLLRRLHVDLFLELPGRLLFGLMGLMFVVALVSGVMVYRPLLHKIGFGVVRSDRSRRVKWLDLHNLLSMLALIWALLVGVTGAFNEISSPLFSLWQRTEVLPMLRSWQGKTPPAPAELASIQSAVKQVQNALPEMRVRSIVFPGSRIGSPYHYVVWTYGATQFSSRMTIPVLIDARSGGITLIADLPWYLRALEYTRPLHFGDYAGLTLKIVWVIFDLMTIVVLASGIYLWVSRRKSSQRRTLQKAKQ